MEAETLITGATSGGGVLAAIGGWQLVKWMKGKNSSNGNGNGHHLTEDRVKVLIGESFEKFEEKLERFEEKQEARDEKRDAKLENWFTKVASDFTDSIRRVHQRINTIPGVKE